MSLELDPLAAPAVPLSPPIGIPIPVPAVATPTRGAYRWPVLANLLRLADFAAIIAAGLLGHWMRFGQVVPADRSARLFLCLGVVVTMAALQLTRSYQRPVLGALYSQVRALLLASFGAMLTVLLVGYLSMTITDYSRIWLGATTLLGGSLLFANRLLLAAAVRGAMRCGQLAEHLVLVGANEQAQRIVHAIAQRKAAGVHILGVFEDRMNRALPALGGIPILGSTEDLLDYVRTQRVDRIVVTLPWIASERIDGLLKKMRTVPVRVDLVPHELIWQFPAVEMTRLAGVPLLTIANGRVDQQLGWIKRLEDIVASSLLILLTSPVLLAVALAIKWDSRGPVIFRQKRHGFNNQVFDVYKFRSMSAEASRQVHVPQATKQDPRVTRIGRFLRKSSLDELPQLFNVLKGDMSIVGPRPHAIQHNHQYAAVITEYFARHNVKPGITGWAQVNGLRGETDTDEKMRRRVEYDLHYIEHWSLLLDFKIILMTAFAVWFQDTAY